MLTRFALISSLVLFSLPACTGGGGDGSGGGGGTGGSSGISGTKQINDLTPGEVMDFCSWSTDEQGGENQSFDCEDFTIEIGTVAECTGSFSTVPQCDLTVRQMEGCVQAQAADPCNGFESAACAPLFACGSDDGSSS